MNKEYTDALQESENNRKYYRCVVVCLWVLMFVAVFASHKLTRWYDQNKLDACAVKFQNYADTFIEPKSNKMRGGIVPLRRTEK